MEEETVMNHPKDVLLEAEVTRIEAQADGATTSVFFYHPQVPEYRGWVTCYPTGQWLFSTSAALLDVPVLSRAAGIRMALQDGFEAGSPSEAKHA